ncbi:MAG: metallophosphoesterase [Candidatus Zixiibacteriota bacterium]
MKRISDFATVFWALISLWSVALGTSNDDESQLSDHPIRFAVIGDRTGEPEPGVHKEIVVEIQRLRPDFVMTVGDLIDGYTDDETELNNQWQDYIELLEPLTMPTHHTPGNHDITTDAMLESYRRNVGEPYYSFDYRDLHLVVLDNSRLDTDGNLLPEQMQWLANDLKTHSDAKQTIVFIHKPFWYETIALGKSHELHDLFAAQGVDAVFSGHFHRYFSGEYDGIIYTGMGSGGGGMRPGPSGLGYHFAWVTVNASEIAIAPIRMASVLPWDEATADDLHFAAEIDRKGLQFSQALQVDGGATVSKVTLPLTVHNISQWKMTDSIRWDIPSGWTVEPNSVAVSLPANSSRTMEFTVASTGKLYPVPTVTAGFPYREDKTYRASASVQVSRQVSCVRTTKPPKIDANICGDVWTQPQALLYSPDGDTSDIDPVEFYFAHDNDNLYLAAHCTEKKMDSIHAIVKERDGAVYGEDCVGFFFCPDPSDSIVYQIYFNPLGTAFDQKIVFDSIGHYEADREWNGTYDVKTGFAKDHWNMEVRIPLAELGTSATTSKQWRLNFRRKQKRLDTSGNWQTPIDYDPKTFGVMILQ